MVIKFCCLFHDVVIWDMNSDVLTLCCESRSTFFSLNLQIKVIRGSSHSTKAAPTAIAVNFVGL